jgi:hypothetical protein
MAVSGNRVGAGLPAFSGKNLGWQHMRCMGDITSGEMVPIPHSAKRFPKGRQCGQKEARASRDSF